MVIIHFVNLKPAPPLQVQSLSLLKKKTDLRSELHPSTRHSLGRRRDGTADRRRADPAFRRVISLPSSAEIFQPGLPANSRAFASPPPPRPIPRDGYTCFGVCSCTTGCSLATRQLHGFRLSSLSPPVVQFSLHGTVPRFLSSLL
jgi:hypothetical protein